ncbi:glycosyltransferase family 61 protein [Brunnivagina elsteri]|uniref:Glycosyltransferase 61 catalytic domain-containing protein n=1 Tax=Brunnivagina elsteri CCALA 953 TaxID=987040 RepID=A0A2A2TMR0_9CYAN|nr:glycosyltransferase family 61 protein [Calothrix elsteri]PAX59722.1 hypothetical protein CK510_05680 [Calothrix elsteri CCALA 953]
MVIYNSKKCSFVEFIFNNFPVNSEILGSPKGFYLHTLDWIKAYKNNKNFCESSYISVHPKHTVVRSRLPKTIDGKIPLEFQDELQHEFPETFVATIPKGRAWSDCAVISPDDKLLADVSRVYVPTTEHPIFRKLKLRPSTYIDRTVCILPVLSGDHNYFHWMFEVLPRIHLLEKSGFNIQEIDHFFLNECRYSFHHETLAALGIPLKKIIEHNKISHIKAKQIVLPSLAGDTPSMAPWVCNFLRDKFLNGTTNKKSLKRIYINRIDAKYRKILNEAQIIDFLSKFGFESLTLALMSVAEQAEIFSSADVIVAPHGAGLANIVFCKPETKVVDIFMPEHINPCYWFLSNCMSLDYYCIFGEKLHESQTEECHTFKKNFEINIKNLSKILEIAGVH